LAAVTSMMLAGLFALVGGSIPAQAVASSRLSVEGCSQNTDNRSSDNWTSAQWKICVGDYSGAHGEVEAQCWAGQTVGWNKNPCDVSGNFEIRKGDEVIKSEGFYFRVPLDGVITARPFRFYCQGNGEYTFTTSGVRATLMVDSSGGSYPRPGYQSMNIADATATVTMC
jgi:hypothetical protein